MEPRLREEKELAKPGCQGKVEAEAQRTEVTTGLL
jgi:hypothetical protein